MLRERPAKAGKADRKFSIAVVAGRAMLGTMLSMVPASFADTLPTNNESQNTSSKAVSSALKLSKLDQAQSSLNFISPAVTSIGSLALQTTGYQTQAKQQAVAENLSALTQDLEGILRDTPYMSQLSTVKSALESVENTLKTPNLPTSDLKGPEKTQGKLQDLVKQLQAIINDASTQYGTELKNAVDDYNKDNLPATERGVTMPSRPPRTSTTPQIRQTIPILPVPTTLFPPMPPPPQTRPGALPILLPSLARPRLCSRTRKSS